MHDVYRVKGAEQMSDLAADIAGCLVGDDALLLTGELGSGKTTFVQALAGALGVVEPVTSPTFTIAAEYTVPGGGRVRRLLHLDLYRLSAGQAAREAAVVDALRAGPDAAVVVEWADRLPVIDRLQVHRLLFEHGDRVDERVVTLVW